MNLVDGRGRPIRIEKQLAKPGGQGSVFLVSSPKRAAFKRLHDRKLAEDPGLEARIRSMVAHRPAGWIEPRSGHVMLTWPTELVFDGRRFVGFLMPLIDVNRTVELHQISNPTDRLDQTIVDSWTHGFTWEYLVGTAKNLALATREIHNSGGVVIGDFNERNVLVWHDSRVTLLDCDSMQLREPGGGRVHFCDVGRLDYTAPELIGSDWKSTVRLASSDLFTLAVHIHQLLLEGSHPFDGLWRGSGDKPKRHLLAKLGMWQYGGSRELGPRPASIPLEVLPRELRELMRLALVAGTRNPGLRPSASVWYVELAKLQNSLVRCSRNAVHRFRRGLTKCPWCMREERSATQQVMPVPSSRQVAPTAPLQSPARVTKPPVKPQPVPQRPVASPSVASRGTSRGGKAPPTSPSRSKRARRGAARSISGALAIVIGAALLPEVRRETWGAVEALSGFVDVLALDPSPVLDGRCIPGTCDHRELTGGVAALAASVGSVVGFVGIALNLPRVLAALGAGAMLIGLLVPVALYAGPALDDPFLFAAAVVLLLAAALGFLLAIAEPSTYARGRQSLANIGWLAAAWWASFVPLSFVTQVWAGSEFSPGQGGGYGELMAWSTMFGLAAVGTVLVVNAWSLADGRDGRSFGEEAYGSAAKGFFLAAILAGIYFSRKGGPEAGDWWIGPLGAWVGLSYGLIKNR